MTYCYTCMDETREGEFCSHCGSRLHTQAPLHQLAPGTILNAKYLIGSFIGEGGFGITYIGKDLNLDVRVAIKEYYPRGLVNRSNDNTNTVSVSAVMPNGENFFRKGKKNFLQEARNIAKFPEEQGIVNVRDFFEENGTAYIVMEYLEGKNLKTYIRENGRMEPSECIRLMYPVMESLQRFHQAGMIHRDISPDNIMFMKNGTLKLMDFGSARYFTNHEQEMSIILKQGYSPEEQYRKNGNQGPWTDVYSLCASIYTCITGQKPESASDRLYRDTLKCPSELGISIRPEQEKALMKGLAVSAENRCQIVLQLMNMLMPGKAGHDIPRENGTIHRHNAGGKQGVSSAQVKKNKVVLVTAGLTAAACICILFTILLLTLTAPEKEDWIETTDVEKLDAGAEADSLALDGMEDEEEGIEIEKLEESQVKELKNKYWRMTKDDLRDAAASSVIKQQEGVSNLPEYLFDNNIQTNWQEGVKGAGIDEFVEYQFQGEYRVCAMSFKLGNWKTQKYYYGNNRPKTLTLTMNQQSWTVSFPDRWEQMGIAFTSPVKTSDLKITIDEVYKGKEWNDTVITDIGVWYE